MKLRPSDSKVHQAMILAAGEGTRLRPLTLQTPKLLLPLADRPLLEYTLNWLKRHGISEIAINLCHLGEKIKDFLGDGARFGVSVLYSEEEKLLGTAGGIKRVEQFFKGRLVVVYGDVLTDFNLTEMVRFHCAQGAVATLVLFPVPNPQEAGIVEVDREGRILSFVEKPSRDSETGNLGNGGIYILEKAVFNYIPGEGFADFAYDVFPRLVSLGLPVYGYTLKPDDYLIDIGTMVKYRKANEDVSAGKLRLGQ